MANTPATKDTTLDRVLSREHARQKLPDQAICKRLDYSSGHLSEFPAVTRTHDMVEALVANLILYGYAHVSNTKHTS